jgi:hypothetical protein
MNGPACWNGLPSIALFRKAASCSACIARPKGVIFQRTNSASLSSKPTYSWSMRHLALSREQAELRPATGAIGAELHTWNEKLSVREV